MDVDIRTIDLGYPTQITLGKDTIITFKEIRQTLDEIHEIKKELSEIKMMLREFSIFIDRQGSLL
jgi:hypothetical protein